jgi:type II secretory pathway pseudopilin PulG
MDVFDRSRAGFSTLEVLVALLILGLSASTVTVMHHRSIARIEQAEFELEAVRTAESVLARIGTEFPLKVGTLSGREKDGLDWKAQITDFEAERHSGLYRVELEILSPEFSVLGRYAALKRAS